MIAMRYAAHTIEHMLVRYGATSFLSGSHGNRSMIAFELQNRRIRFILPLPDEFSDAFVKTRRKRLRSEAQRTRMWEQGCRQRWRALALAIKAKLEAVETGISTFEEEFLAHIVLPNGSTVGEWMTPQIESAYQRKAMPPLLPHLPKEGL